MENTSVFMSADFLSGGSLGFLLWLLGMGVSATWKTFQTFITPPDLLKGE